MAVISLIVWGAARFYLRFRRARVALVAVVVGLGGLVAYQVLRAEWAYEAAFLYQQCLFAMISALAGCAIMGPFQRTRQSARVGAVGILLMLGGFFAVYLPGYWFGFYLWGGNVAVPVR